MGGGIIAANSIKPSYIAVSKQVDFTSGLSAERKTINYGRHRRRGNFRHSV